MQNVSFRSVEELLEDSLEKKEWCWISSETSSSISYAELRKSFPAMFLLPDEKGCLFICPASIFRGKKTHMKACGYAFPYGHLLLDDFGYLNKGKRIQVSWCAFFHIQEIGPDPDVFI